MITIIRALLRPRVPLARGFVVGLFSALFLSLCIAHTAQSATGNLDRTFNNNGKAVANFGEGPTAVAIQKDGKIIVAGDSTSSGTDDFALVRYNINGIRDAPFGKKGKVLTDFKSQFGTSQSDQAYAVAIQKDCKIVAAGVSSSDSSGFAVARYQNSSCGNISAETSDNDGFNR